MPCNPNDNSLNPPLIPGIPVPGFGIPFSPISIPLPDFTFPEGFPENILDLLNKLTALFPAIEFKPNLDDLTNSILKGISSVLSQIAPFIGLYRFFQAALNMILCIIEVLCTIPNPFRLVRAMTRLFKRCLPDFLNLFPWLALLAMLIALLLLILAFIEYIIDRLTAFIEEIIKNLLVLGEGLSLQNEDASLAAAQKIAQLLCLIDNLLAILTAIAAILAVFEALAGISGRTVCGDSGSSSGDDVGCCDEAVCPAFISNNESLIGTSGELVYFNAILPDTSSFPGFPSSSLNPVREESWQFVNQQVNQQYKFREIIDVIVDNGVNPPTENTFFPDGQFYETTANTSKIPYSLTTTINSFDPQVFHPSDTAGARTFVIKNMVINRPYIGIYDYDNQINTSFNDTGTLPISGGKVYEADGTTPYLVNGVQATLETFIHSDPSVGSLPAFEDGYFKSGIEFDMHINHPILMDLGLITLGCIPSLAVERIVVNARANAVGLGSVISRIGALPNVTAAQTCAAQAMAQLRANVSVQNASIAQQTIISCLNTLQLQTQSSISELINNGTSVFTSTATIDPNIQFVTRKIKATVTLKDAGGTNVCANLPDIISNDVSSQIQGGVTLGEITNFVYDGYAAFNADITSSFPGDGYFTVSFAGNIFSTTLNLDNDSIPSSIEEVRIPYTFIGLLTSPDGSGQEASPRRDATDVSRDSS
jgi:hypothetical protein